MTIEQNRVEGILEIVIQRDSSLNALDTAHLQALQQCFEQASTDDSIRVLLLRGGGRAFSVGGDIKEMDTMSDTAFSQTADLYQRLCRQARALDKPIIAAINGYALGGGLEIALIADLRIAAQSAKLGLPDAELGFSPTGGLTYLLNRMVGAGWAMHLALSCEVLDAKQALAIGLVTRVVDDDQLLDEAMKLAQQIAAYPASGLARIKQSFNRALEASLESSLELEAKLDLECYRSEETRQALRAFLQSRKK